MSTVRRVVHASPQRVWDVLVDGWLYPLWVVGASRMRRVDATWPGPGSRLHHSAGSWPFVVDDTTSVLECAEGERLVLEARGWPLGQATVAVTLTPRGPDETDVRLDEDASAGPGRLVPRPVRTPLLTWRNTESLRRLALLAERRTH